MFAPLSASRRRKPLRLTLVEENYEPQDWHHDCNALLAVFGIGHVRAFVTHGQFGCAAASAQQAWDDGDSVASESDDGSSDVAAAQNSPDKASAIKFNGSGAFDSTPTAPCSADHCFSITGSVTTSFSGLGTGDVAGDGTLDNCKINKHAKKECCTLASTQTYSFSNGNLDVMFAGTVCGKTPTKVTAKNAPYEFTGGSGLFAGASGSGKATFTYNEDTGAGTFTFKGKLSE